MSRAARIAAGAFGLFALLTLGYALLRVSERGRFATPYSTFGAGPEGARALSLFAQSLGYRTEALTHELSELPGGTLVALFGCHAEGVRKVSRPEREAIARWVEAGGLLIAIGVSDVVPHNAGLLFQSQTACADSEEPATPLEAWLSPRDATIARARSQTLAEAAGPPLSYLLPFSVHEPLPLRIGHDAEATEILSSEQGSLGLTAPYGRGRIVLLGIPEAFTNSALSDGGGLLFARLLRAFAPQGPVLFDEYHLGMGERRSLIGYLRGLGFAPLLAQALLAVLVTMWASSVRIAPSIDASPAPARVKRSFLEALSALFRESEDTRSALVLLGNAALGRIARSYHAPAIAPKKLESWLATRGQHAVVHYVRAITRHAGEPLSPNETLTSRAHAIEQDAAAALAIATLEPGSRR